MGSLPWFLWASQRAGQDQTSALAHDLAGLAQRLQRLGHADAMGADQEAQLFVGERELDHKAGLGARAVLASHRAEYRVEALLEMGRGEVPDPAREPVDALAHRAHDLQADVGLLSHQALEALPSDAAQQASSTHSAVRG